MAEFVEEWEDIKDLKPARYGITLPVGYLNPESDKDMVNAVAFSPNKGKWHWKCTQDWSEMNDDEYVFVSIYWSERDPDSRVIFANPFAGKHEREEIIQKEIELQAKAKKRARLELEEFEDAGGDPDAVEKQQE